LFASALCRRFGRLQFAVPISANFSDDTVDLVFEMQLPGLQVGDCEFIGRVLKPRLGNFVLHGFAPAFQVFYLA
jgi:hypothetical protein